MFSGKSWSTKEPTALKANAKQEFHNSIRADIWSGEDAQRARYEQYEH
jgi:hypothetical protein